MNAIDTSLSSSPGQPAPGAFADAIVDLFGELGLSLSDDLGSDLAVF